MSKITGLTAGKGRGKRVNVFLDGAFAFSLSAEVAVKDALKVGRELSDSEVSELKGMDGRQRCYNAAVRYLGLRPRSESEIRQRLQRYGHDNDCIDRTVDRLKEQGLVDDSAFAEFWKENRETFSPRSRWLTGVELKRKGLDDSIIEHAVKDVDDTDNAYRAAMSKAGRLSSSDYQDFRRRLGDYLNRRGFTYDIINTTVDRVWEEQGRVPR